MALFGKREEFKNKTELEKYMDTLDKYSNMWKVQEVLRYLKGIISLNNPNLFDNGEMLIQVMEKYLSTQSESDMKIEEYVQMVKNEFSQVYFSNKIDSQEMSMFLRLFDTNGIYERDLFDINFYRMFDNMKQYYAVMENIMSNDFIMENIDKVLGFFLNIRSYYETGDKYYFEVLTMSKNMTYGINLDDYIKTYMNKLDKRSGVYEVDEVLLDKIHEKTVGAEGFLTSLDESIKNASNMLNVLKGRASSYSMDLDDINRKRLAEYEREIKDKIEEITDKLIQSKDELNKFMLDLQNKAREEVSSDSNKALEELRTEKEKILESLKQYESVLTNLAMAKSSEIARIGGQQLSAIDELIKKQPHLKEILESVMPNQQTIELISQMLDSKKEINSVNPNMVVPNQSSTIVQAPSIVSGAPGLIIPPVEIDNTVNKFLDKNISVDDRMEMIEKKIKENKEKGILYNKDIMEAIYYLIRGCSPYLYGPSGSGKTTLARQIYELLGLKYKIINYVNEEYEITGSTPFLGNWTPSLLYYAYKGGIGLVIDEFDNGHAKANQILAPFISASYDTYTFTNGETVKMHPNFRLIATGNTLLQGATENHPDREKFDVSIRRRFKSHVLIDYDKGIESKILSGHEEWYSFIEQFRIAGMALNNDESETTIKGAVTTSDILDIADSLKTKYATKSLIIRTDFIRTHDSEYLSKLKTELEKYYSNHGSKEEKEIYKVFSEEVLKRQRVRGR